MMFNVFDGVLFEILFHYSEWPTGRSSRKYQKNDSNFGLRNICPVVPIGIQVESMFNVQLVILFSQKEITDAVRERTPSDSDNSFSCRKKSLTHLL